LIVLRMGALLRIVAGTVGALLALPVLAQSLPYHADPTAREMLAGNSVPAIRFLTTADFRLSTFATPMAS
jgi:hypothetical protein